MKFKKDELLAIIKKNRQEHREIFEEACDGYEKRMIAHLATMMGDVKARRPVSHHISLVQPVDQTKEYDRAIKMLNMCVEEEIELTEDKFANYVMDDWHWKGEFLGANSSYSRKAQSMM